MFDDLREAAFGGAPVVPGGVPAAPQAKLLTAIVLGAQGSYAAAMVLLGEVAKGSDAVLASLACSAFASHRRQLGGHRAAFGPDGTALRLVAGLSGHEDRDGLDAEGARADALLGLAADNLGIGRLTTAMRLLDRVQPHSWRSKVRLGWVTAEIELADGQAGKAVAPAEAALELAVAAGALRHAVKSRLVLAAALGATGERGRAAHLVGEAFGVSDKYALRSLSWPAGLLAAEHKPDVDDRDRFRVDAAVHAVLLRTDPEGRRLASESPWVPA